MTESEHPIFNRILISRIDVFRQEFQRLSREIFRTSDGKLFHAAEFGSYREEITRDFIRMFVPARLEISDGFILNRNNEISTQSDIIIFDPTKSPLIQSQNRLRFFFNDSVCGIGEVKSVLSRKGLEDCLLKLARQKETRGHPHNAGSLYEEEAQAFTFVICERLDVKGDLNEAIEEVYAKGAVPSRMRHNVILSIEDGIAIYSIQGDLPVAFPDRNARANEFLWGSPATHPEPQNVDNDEGTRPERPKVLGSTVDHIGLFCSLVFEAMKQSRSFDYRFADYLGEADLNWSLGRSLTINEPEDGLSEEQVPYSEALSRRSTLDRIRAMLPW
ncbi:DUF6602 domain-containing protein [Agrobacterium rubi]|uniref:DUF6602 domain-containing protein n=1 Tax=Agrobacterium rubi TaxID=28099 RepID=A0AAE7RCV7_9HYPH|nr:DUF6602 domain-containing protein [Agrobacterium rubi]NTE90150.1 hypothetical protein [Agrobacterium rubi]NTF04856.1 hypothetical protein [Agrobacterium rubi]NTF39417.1 hypothetical protein [Agrobacterium rubi]QTG03051.1 hypothetical protein G6M88_22095 [Agrobacterium rubi]